MDTIYQLALIDDDAQNLAELKRLFERPDLGFTVACASLDPVSYIAHFEDCIPDAVITAMCMKNLSGIDLIQYIRQLRYDIPIVVVSRCAEFQYAQSAIRLKVMDYCLKPMNDDKAEEVIKKLTEEIEKQKLLAEYDKLRAGESYNVQNDGFKDMLEYIEQNYGRRLLLTELAPKFFLNSNYCCVLFNRYKGMTFSQYLTKIRMEKAKYFLKKTDLPIKQISSIVGFGDYFYFNKVFKKTTEMTPFEFRKANRCGRKDNNPECKTHPDKDEESNLC